MYNKVLNTSEIQNRAIAKMIAPGEKRPGKYRDGVIQIWITRLCDKSCYGCTQGSNLAGFKKDQVMTPEQFEIACLTLKDYFGVVGIFGGNPATHPQFDKICEILRAYIPYERRGLWCNNPLGKGNTMRITFNPAVSNLNVHLDAKAYNEFIKDWPDSRPVGLNIDSRHSPPYVAIKDIVKDEYIMWDKIADCDINKHWSAMIATFRGKLRAWFCEIAGAQSILHQENPSYPDTGIPLQDDNTYTNSLIPINLNWWKHPINYYRHQILKHCQECGIPLRGHGELAQNKDTTIAREQVSETHKDIFVTKDKNRRIELVTVESQLMNNNGRLLDRVTNYLSNSTK